MAQPIRLGIKVLAGISLVGLAVLALAQTATVSDDGREDLVARGRYLFFNETFEGNGRTCGSCYPAENNFTLDAAFIATLPDDDPLFVAELNPELMRQFGLILENLDGFEDLEKQFVMRGVPHTFAFRASIDGPRGPHLGWSGDGSPGNGSLRSFATGAVIHHFPKTLNRIRRRRLSLAHQ